MLVKIFDDDTGFRRLVLERRRELGEEQAAQALARDPAAYDCILESHDEQPISALAGVLRRAQELRSEATVEVVGALLYSRRTTWRRQ